VPACAMAAFGEGVTAVVAPPRLRGRESVRPWRARRASSPNYKMPKRIFIVEDLPSNTMGKVQKTIAETYKDIILSHEA